MSREFKIAIVGVKNLKGKTLKEQLEKSKIPIKDVYLFDPSVEEEYALLDEFAGEAKVVKRPSKDELERMDLVFFAADRATTEPLFEGNFVAVDLLSVVPSAPRAVSGVNLDRLEGLRAANPLPPTIGLAHVLHPVMEEFGLKRAIVVMHEPASEYNEEGMDELFEQAYNTLNMEEIPRKVLKDRLAFNIKPSRAAGGKEFSEKEVKLRQELADVLGGQFHFSAVIMRSSVFHRYSAMVYLETDREVGKKEIKKALSSNRFVKLAGEKEIPSPAEMEEEGEFVHVGSIKEEPAEKGAFWLWIVFDNLLVGSALNALDIAYHLLRKRYEEIP